MQILAGLDYRTTSKTKSKSNENTKHKTAEHRKSEENSQEVPEVSQSESVASLWWENIHKIVE